MFTIPLEDGLVESLARPGGNVTGLTSIIFELNGKRLELLKEVFPLSLVWASCGTQAEKGPPSG
jgi:putative tryptophan/tyrosine transport system substrate-binding protein